MQDPITDTVYCFALPSYCDFLSTPVVQWLYSPLDPMFAGSNTAGVERKNPEYDFIRKRSKAVGPVS